MNSPSDQPDSRVLDAIVPAEMARRAQTIGVKKATMPMMQTFVLAVLAGAFIALGAVFATIVSTGGQDLPFGVSKLLGGISFSLGLILVVVAGAELFTGNNLIIMAAAAGQVTLRQVARNWAIVFFGNFVGAMLTAVIVFVSGQYTFADGAVGTTMLSIANHKCQLGFVQAIALGMLCNALVCLAVWLCLSAHSTTDKIVAIIFPITAFVAAGFEHSVANMYFIPVALLVKSFAPETFWQAVGASASDYPLLTWSNFFVVNLLPVTIGNVIGGAGMVGLVYWFVYLRNAK